MSTVDYIFVQKMFDKGWDYGKGWKSYYFGEAQNCFKKHFEPLNKWRPNKKDSTKYGHYDDDDKWSWTNRINTHPNCCLSFYKWGVKYNPDMFIEFGNPKYHEYNAKKMWEFVDEFFDLIFTTSKTDKYLRELKVKCLKSWNSGNITLISIIMSLKESFGDISDINYTFEYGDSDDMNGVDLSFRLPDGTLKTMQIKSGKFEDQENEFYVNGSQNDLTYKTDYYGYANVDDWRGITSVIIFDNVPNLKKEHKTIIVEKENVKYNKIKHMAVPEKLNELLILCGKNNIEFTLKRNDEINEVDYNDTTKKITVLLTEFEDENLEKLLDDKLKELKETFK